MSENLTSVRCCDRLASAVLLRQFINWLVGVSTSGPANYPVWKGWVLAAVLGSTGYILCLIHHQLFWCVSMREPLEWVIV